MSDKYILVGKEPVQCNDLMAWTAWFEKSDRTVAKTKIGKAEVSTVFLGLDHSFGSGKPLLFETMVFGGKLANEMDRYHTWEEAEEGHFAMCKRVRERMAEA